MDKEWLHNGGFELWEAGRPARWRASEGHGAQWKAVELDKTADAHSGKAAVALHPPDAGHWLCMAQPVEPYRIVLDRTVRFAARVKASQPDQVYVTLSFGRNGRRFKPTRIANGTGEWEELEWLFEVPPDADPSSFRFEILRKSGRPGEALVDDVSVRHVMIEEAWRDEQ